MNNMNIDCLDMHKKKIFLTKSAFDKQSVLFNLIMDLSVATTS
jgi:hypothetical protein